jgi:hypothetical protein
MLKRKKHFGFINLFETFKDKNETRKNVMSASFVSIYTRLKRKII